MAARRTTRKASVPDLLSPTRAPTPAAPALPRVHAWMVIALAAATFLAYLPALRAPFVMDDESAIAESAAPVVHVPAGSPVAGRPVARATIAANHALNTLLGVDQRRDPDGPDKAIGYRLLNIVFHLCTGALLFGFLRRAMRERTIAPEWRAAADPMAAAVCALWLLHPIQTEAINYVVQRTELLASLFWVATLYASVRAWDAASDGARLRWYSAGVLACVLGVGSKEVAISAPLAVVLYDRAFRLESWRALRRPGNGRGWFQITLAGAALATYAFAAAGARGATAGFGGGVTWYAYFVSQGWAISRYLRLVAWPNALVIDYGDRAVPLARALPGLALLSLFAAATLLAWRRIPRFGWFAFLGAAFFMLLAPSSSIVPVSTEIAAERRIYLALAAVLVLVVVGAEWARRRYLKQLPARALAYVAAAVAVALAATTAVRSGTYSTSERLWRDAVAKVPDNPRAAANLGHALLIARPPQFAEAEVSLRRAMSLDPTCRLACVQLAAVLDAQGRAAESMALLERVLAGDSANVQAEQALAVALMKTGDFAAAIPHLQRIALRRPSSKALLALGVADLAVQRRQDALAAFQQAAALDPTNPDIRRIGGTLFDAGRNEAALPALKDAAIKLAQAVP